MSITLSIAADTVKKPFILASTGNTLYVGGIGQGNYTKIQDAIDDANPGDTVFVYDDSSPYYENIWIYESINLIGENKYTTQINGSGIDGKCVIVVNAHNVIISNFNIENSGAGAVTMDSGIFSYKDDCTFTNNIITYNKYGVTLSSADRNNISNNIIIDNRKKGGVGFRMSGGGNNYISYNLISKSGYLIWMSYSSYNTIFKNEMNYGDSGIWSEFCNKNIIIHNNISYNCNRGIDLYDCDYNNISYNYIDENGEDDGPILGDDGIMIRVNSNNNVVYGNYISRHWDYGIWIPYHCNNNVVVNNDIVNNYDSCVGMAIGYWGFHALNNNTIYHNNFINNTIEAKDSGNDTSKNYWNDSYPSSGNYWDDYPYEDNNQGPNQSIPGSDGIGDIPYNIPGNADNFDYYPLMEPWNTPPYTPNSPKPNHEDSDVSINTGLSWKGGDKFPGPVTYDIYFGTNNPPSLVKSNQSSTRYKPDQLSISTTYYWKIVTWDIHGASSEGPIWQFTTNAINNNPPNTPSNPNPENGMINVSIEDNILEWSGGDPDDDSVSYDVFFGKKYFFHKISDNQSSTNYSLGTLDYDRKYFWQIVAWDEHRDPTKGPVWSFRTVENNPPNKPDDPEPPKGATDVDIEDVVLSWNCSDPENHSLTYDVYFQHNLVSEKQTENTYELGTLKYGTRYYWQIIAYDDYGGETNGPIWYFTTIAEPNDPPYEPGDPSPENGSIGVDVDIDISWVGGDPDEGDTIVYDVYLEANNPDPKKVADDFSETWFDPGVLDYNTTYYWKIIACDNHYAVNESPVWHFTTVVNLPPDAPSINGQTSGKPGKYYSYKVTAVDPEGHHVFYYIDWGDGTFEEWSGPYISGMGRNFTHAWEKEGIYLIKVKAKDIYDAESDWSEFEVTIPRIKIAFNSWFLRILEWFPMLRYLLGLR